MAVLENSDQQSLSPKLKTDILQYLAHNFNLLEPSFCELDIGFSHTARKIKIESKNGGVLLKFSRKFQDIGMLKKLLPIADRTARSANLVKILKSNSGTYLCEISGLRPFYIMEFVKNLKPIKIPDFHQALEILSDIHSTNCDHALPTFNTCEIVTDLLFHYPPTAKQEVKSICELLIVEAPIESCVSLIHGDALFSNFGVMGNNNTVLFDIDEMSFGCPGRDVAAVALSWFGINFIGWTSSLHPTLRQNPDWASMRNVLATYNTHKKSAKILEQTFWIEVWNQMIELYTLGIIRGDVTYSNVINVLSTAHPPKLAQVFTKKAEYHGG